MDNKDIITPQQSFLGRGWSFPPTFNQQSGDVQLVSDEKDIDQALEIIITTNLRERVMRPDFGCGIRDFVFEPLDTSLKTYLRDVIDTAITYHEPRIDVGSVSVAQSTDPIEGKLLIEVEYKIRATNTRYNKVYPYDLSEATVFNNR